MVSSIQSSFQGMDAMQGMGMQRRPQSITDEQKKQIQNILSQYDSSNVTAEDAKSIFEAFKSAGIQPGPGMRETIEAAGFDAEAMRTMGMPEPPPGGGMQGVGGQQGINLTALQSLQDILSQYDMSNMSDDEKEQLLGQLNSAGLMKTGYTIDLKM